MNNSQWVRFIWTNTFEKQDTILHFPGLFVALTLLCWFPAFVSLSSCRDCYLVLPLLTLSFGTDHVPTGEKSNSNGLISSTVFFFWKSQANHGYVHDKKSEHHHKNPSSGRKRKSLKRRKSVTNENQENLTWAKNKNRNTKADQQKKHTQINPPGFSSAKLNYNVENRFRHLLRER